MMYHLNKVQDVRDAFVYKKTVDDFGLDKTGQKVIELISANFLANESYIFGVPNSKYINSEIEWYESQSTNINDIYGGNQDPPKAWVATANQYGEINSNYGYHIYSSRFHNQFYQVLNELKRNPISRRATMIYSRPSMWVEYNENGKNDFCCTNAVTYYVREKVLNCVVQMRSNDVVFGYKNDYAWQKYILDKLAKELNIPSGKIFWQVQNLHVYERHFHLVN